MRGYWSELWAAILHPVRLTITLFLSIFLGITGPFGTFAVLDIKMRLLYWLIIVGLAFLIVVNLRHFYQKLMPKLGLCFINPLVFLSLSVLLTPIIVLLIRPFIESNYRGYIPNWTLGFFIFGVGMLVDFVRRLIITTLGLENAETSRQNLPNLLDRIPRDARGDLLQVSGKDHHVEIRTTRGVSTIRLRLVDAINEINGVDGICTHRSHWVAIAAVIGHESVGTPSKQVLILTDGTRVPISRKYAPAVEARGLLKDV